MDRALRARLLMAEAAELGVTIDDLVAATPREGDPDGHYGAEGPVGA